jgi:hypothetical protein
MAIMSQLHVSAAPPLLPAAAAVLVSRPCDLISSAPAALGSTAAGSAAELLAVAAQALWGATLPTTAMCQPASGGGGDHGDGDNASSAAAQHEQQQFHEEAPALPAGTLHYLQTGRLAAALAAYRPFAGGYARARSGDYAGDSVDVSNTGTHILPYAPEH